LPSSGKTRCERLAPLPHRAATHRAEREGVLHDGSVPAVGATELTGSGRSRGGELHEAWILNGLPQNRCSLSRHSPHRPRDSPILRPCKPDAAKLA
jgi:hypothetical protein